MRRVLGLLALAMLVLSFGTAWAGEGIISIDKVQGALGHDTVAAGQNLRFIMRFNNDVGVKCDVANGWKISTADGATWDSVTMDSAGPIVSGENRFILYFNQVFSFWGGPLQSGNGSNPDTVGFIAAGSPTNANRQLAVGYNDTGVAVIVWFTGNTSHGKHICIDTNFFGTGGTWKWVDRNLVDHLPAFNGLPGQVREAGDGSRYGSGYCFLIWDPAQGVDGVDGPSLPKEFALRQNYPNPFNPTTTVKFDVPKRSQVKLTVYNVLGQKVKTLVDGVLEAKAGHEVTWDGITDGGSSVSSGIYFYKMEAGSFVQTKKMVMMK